MEWVILFSGAKVVLFFNICKYFKHFNILWSDLHPPWGEGIYSSITGKDSSDCTFVRCFSEDGPVMVRWMKHKTITGPCPGNDLTKSEGRPENRHIELKIFFKNSPTDRHATGISSRVCAVPPPLFLKGGWAFFFIILLVLFFFFFLSLGGKLLPGANLRKSP